MALGKETNHGNDSGKMGDMKSDINITPLVDVVLVLLIIFMVVTPLLQRGYETKVPPKVKTGSHRRR